MPSKTLTKIKTVLVSIDFYILYSSNLHRRSTVIRMLTRTSDTTRNIISRSFQTGHLNHPMPGGNTSLPGRSFGGRTVGTPEALHLPGLRGQRVHDGDQQEALGELQGTGQCCGAQTQSSRYNQPENMLCAVSSMERN